MIVFEDNMFELKAEILRTKTKSTYLNLRPDCRLPALEFPYYFGQVT